MKNMFRKSFAAILCLSLIACLALAGCSGEAPKEGEKSFTLVVADIDGNETSIDIVTDKATVGEALIEKEIISGEEGPYGLYIKTVNGITADYDTDGTYWAFYENGEYALQGIDLTNVTDGAIYELRVEKG
ncbi:MAG: DUF4430 domain-containing protein [Clostridia bacterium]|nr:DUF4430 domain-containing protein [Clostridia bacterium]